MVSEKLKDFICLMLGMKAEDKKVTLDHIFEKVNRDMGCSKEEVKNAVQILVKQGLLSCEGGLYSATEKARDLMRKKLWTNPEYLADVNPTYVMKFKAAKIYYPEIGPHLLPLLKGRAVGMYRVFTDRQFFQRKFKGKWVVIDNMKDLMFWVNAHGLDLIPCIHPLNKKIPDWLIIDVDAQENAFEEAKRACQFVFEYLKKRDLHPLIKFSGSRGFHIWIAPEPPKVPNIFEFYRNVVKHIEEKMFEEMPEVKGKLKLDTSPLKPWGLVRAPYSIHHKTFLTSLPLNVDEVEEFKKEEAKILSTLKRFRERGFEWNLKKERAERLFKEIKGRQMTLL